MVPNRRYYINWINVDWDFWRHTTSLGHKTKTIWSRDTSMARCKTALSPLLRHWRYCSLALSHRHIGRVVIAEINADLLTTEEHHSVKFKSKYEQLLSRTFISSSADIVCKMVAIFIPSNTVNIRLASIVRWNIQAHLFLCTFHGKVTGSELRHVTLYTKMNPPDYSFYIIVFCVWREVMC